MKLIIKCFICLQYKLKKKKRKLTHRWEDLSNETSLYYLTAKCKVVDKYIIRPNNMLP